LNLERTLFGMLFYFESEFERFNFGTINN